HGIDTAYLLSYVDDIVLTASFETLLQHIINSLHQEFSMTDLSSLNYFLGILVMRDSSGMFLSLCKYAREILERAVMVSCNSSRTPIDTESKLGDDGDPDPREPHFSDLKRLLIQMQIGLAALLLRDRLYCAFLGNDLLSWSFKRQPTLSRSKVEYRGVANAVAETWWLRNLLRELHTHLSSATLVYCDNVSVVYLFSNPVQHQRTKHIEINIHFVRDLVFADQVQVFHVPSRYQYADIFTKGLPSALFEEFRTSLSVARGGNCAWDGGQALTSSYVCDIYSLWACDSGGVGITTGDAYKVILYREEYEAKEIDGADQDDGGYCYH
ncbi:ribonuclease H-like domain-containing protein, partial [Tanacetum coccineum]